MEIKGKLTQKFNPEQMNNGMTKMAFIVQQEGKYGKPVKFDTFKAPVISFLNDTQIGSDVVVSFNASSKDWTNPNTGKVSWFTNLNASNVMLETQMQQNYQQPPQQTYYPNQPSPQQVNHAFQQPPQQFTPSGQPMNNNDEPDDLPF